MAAGAHFRAARGTRSSPIPQSSQLGGKLLGSGKTRIGGFSHGVAIVRNRVLHRRPCAACVLEMEGAHTFVRFDLSQIATAILPAASLTAAPSLHARRSILDTFTRCKPATRQARKPAFRMALLASCSHTAGTRFRGAASRQATERSIPASTKCGCFSSPGSGRVWWSGGECRSAGGV